MLSGTRFYYCVQGAEVSSSIEVRQVLIFSVMGRLPLPSPFDNMGVWLCGCLIVPFYMQLHLGQIYCTTDPVSAAAGVPATYRNTVNKLSLNGDMLMLVEETCVPSG
jgi:hypothetical protein